MKAHEFERLIAGRPSGDERMDRKWRLAERAGYRCALCGQPLAVSLDCWLAATQEHVVPQVAASKYGYPDDLVNCDGNCMVVCRKCNTLAGDPRVIELLESMPPLRERLDFDDYIENFLETKRDIVRERRQQYRDFYRQRVLRPR